MKRTVLIAAIDRSEITSHVLDTVVSYARATPLAEIHLLHAVDTGTPLGNTAIALDQTIAQANAFLDEQSRRLSEHFPGTIALHLAVGSPVGQIVQLASDLRADLIVVGKHGKSLLERIALGSVSQAVVDKAPCPVLVVRPNAYPVIPEIEPACPGCLEVQQASAGKTMWCERHGNRHAHAHGHLHYAAPAPFAVGSLLLRPES